MKLRDRDRAFRPVGFDRFHHRIEHAHGHRHVGGVRGDTRFARAHDREVAIEAVDRRAAAAGLAFVARLIGVVKIGAAGALEQIARGRRLVAQLPRRPASSAREAPRNRGGCARRTRDRYCAPARRCAGRLRGVGSILSSPRRLTSTRCAGVSIWSFIRSSKLVPPAMNLLLLRRQRVAAATGSGRPLVGKGFNRPRSVPRDFIHGLDDVGVGARSDKGCRSSARAARFARRDCPSDRP